MGRALDSLNLCDNGVSIGKASEAAGGAVGEATRLGAFFCVVILTA